MQMLVGRFVVREFCTYRSFCRAIVLAILFDMIANGSSATGKCEAEKGRQYKRGSLAKESVSSPELAI